jgi:signal transduction histidine kinase/CheY-like chemotaxis protein
MTQRRSLGLQFLVAGGMVVLISLLSLGFLRLRMSEQEKVTRRLVETERSIAGLGGLERVFFLQKTAYLRFVQTRDPQYKEAVRELASKWREEQDRFRQLLNGPNEAAVLEELERAREAWARNWESRLRGSAAEPATVQVEERLSREIELALARLAETKRRQDVDQLAVWAGETRSTFRAMLWISAGLLLIFGIGFARLYLSIARPIVEMAEVMHRFRGGDLGARAALGGQGEIRYLEQSFNELASSTQGMVAELKRLDEMKSDFISTVSHELRTPLTSIAGYVKLLLGGEVGKLEGAQREFLDVVDSNVARLARLINDILDVSKMEAGKAQIRREPVELGELLRQAVGMMGVLARQKGLEFRFKPAPEPLPLTGDPARLEEMITNLLSNAIKYTSKGWVELSAERTPYAAVIRVSDSGVGLTRDELDRLFEKFYRARSAISGTEGGTGLGLVIARGWVEAHGGRIAVESEPGKGTVFTVTLPLERATGERVAQAAAHPAALEAGEAAGPALVWVVETGTDRLSSALQGQEPNGLSIRRFPGPEQFPEVRSHAEAPDLVVVDLDSCGSSPHEVLPRIRELTHASVTVLTVGSRGDPASAALAEGAAGWLPSQVEPSRLGRAVRELLKRRSWRLLLADNNTDLRLLLKRSLERGGFRVDDVDRGGDVLTRLEQEHYDLALLDMNLVDMPAHELARIIHGLERFRELPVFLMSLEESELQPGDARLRFVSKQAGIGSVVEQIESFFESGGPS